MIKNIHRFSKIFGYVFLTIIIAIAIAALGIAFSIRLSNELQQYSVFPFHPPPTKNQRITVYAPHCDDEVLGCGGMLAYAEKAKANVNVVMVTNGDGFKFAVARQFRTMSVTSEKCVEMAYIRQKETLGAFKILGIPSSKVTFLGYPDRGVSQLWDTNWTHDKLFTSKATGWSHSYYKNSLTKNAPYCGESLLDDIVKTLMRNKPTDVYVPNPSDNHPDHFATYCFVLAAIEQLSSKKLDFADKINVHTYLVHRGDWPTDSNENGIDYMVPPSAMVNAETNWNSLLLNPDVLEKKTRAIKNYKTQIALGKNFLLKFAKVNELFGDLPKRSVANVESNRISVDGNIEDWSGIAPAIVAPVNDYVVAELSRSGDVRNVFACKDKYYTYLRIDCVGRLSGRVKYIINLRGVTSEKESSRYTVWVRPKRRSHPGNLIWAYRNNVIEIAIPNEKLKYDNDLFIQVYTRLPKLIIDNTGWQDLKNGHKSFAIPHKS